jgi:hypothetical protein
VTAVGGDTTAQTTTYDSSTYQLPVTGGNVYTVSASCGLKDAAGNLLSVSFSQRTISVAPGATETNDYVFNNNFGIVRLHVDITGDPTTSSVSIGSWATKTPTQGEKTAT